MYVRARKLYPSVSERLCRFLSTAEVATALRPFYFSVHPDLFGKHPAQRTVNEDSLKQLSAYLASFNSRGKVTSPHKLPFYIRTTSDRGAFKLIHIPLGAQNDPYSVLSGILKACNLPTDYVDNMPKPNRRVEDISNAFKDADFTKSDSEEFAEEVFSKRVKYARDSGNLKDWLTRNAKLAKDRRLALIELKDEVLKMQNKLVQELALTDLRWECGWNVEHYRGCLKSLQGLVELHSTKMDVLKGRILVFGSFTGVSLDGHVMLNSGEVRNNWLDLIKNVDVHTATLRNIPSHEAALSKVLLDIKVGRRTFMPKVLASEYAAHLRRITTSLLDFLSKHHYPENWPSSLRDYEIVVECEAGPMMVNPSGQMITPSTCPGALLVDFIDENLNLANKKMMDYSKNKCIEESLHDKCIIAYNIESLTKDDSVDPDRMIECLKRLLNTNASWFDNSLNNATVHVTNYYSVLSDGTICIPWDWKLH